MRKLFGIIITCILLRPIPNLDGSNETMCLPSFKPQVDDQIEEIRSATLTILEEVGVHFPSERALKVFSDYGARVIESVRKPA